MPNYEYECTKCGHRFEIFQKMTDPKLKTCPECKGRVERLIGPGAGVVFKGQGFYQTDYRSESYKQAAKSEAGGGAGGGGGGEGKAAKSDTGKEKGGNKEGAKKEGGKGAETGGKAKPAGGGEAGTRRRPKEE